MYIIKLNVVLIGIFLKYKSFRDNEDDNEGKTVVMVLVVVLSCFCYIKLFSFVLLFVKN